MRLQWNTEAEVGTSCVYYIYSIYLSLDFVNASIFGDIVQERLLEKLVKLNFCGGSAQPATGFGDTLIASTKKFPAFPVLLLSGSHCRPID